MAEVRTENTTYIGKEFLSKSSFAPNVRRHPYTAPAAASTTNMVNAHALDGSNVTPALQPDVARTLQFQGNSGANVVIPLSGTDIRGNAISENVTLNGTTPVITVNAYLTVNPIPATTQAAHTFSVGFYTGLGLGRKMSEDGVFKATVDGAADSALPTVAYNASTISKNFVTFATAPNATHNYVVFYCSEEVYAIG